MYGPDRNASLSAQPALATEASAGWLVPTLTLATFITATSVFGLGPFLPVIADELGSAGHLVILTYLAAFLVERHGLDTLEVGWAYLVAGLGGLLGNWLAGGWLGVDPRTMMTAARLLGGAVLAAALVLPLPVLARSRTAW